MAVAVKLCRKALPCKVLPGGGNGFGLDVKAQHPTLFARKAAEEGVTLRTPTTAELEQLTAPEERELIRHLAALTDDVVTAAKTYDPAKITHYVIDLATLFHKFYNAQRVMVEDEGLMQARLYLCTAVKNTIRNVLTMLKISVPERM